MNKKEMEAIIKNPVKFAKKYFPHLDSNGIRLLANIAKQLEIFNKKQQIEFNKKKDNLWRNKKKEVKVKEKHFDGVNVNNLNIVTGTPSKGFRTPGIYINKKGEIKVKKITVKKAVRDLIVSYPYMGNEFGVFPEHSGISNWKIEHAHPKHQMSGLRELRHLKDEYFDSGESYAMPGAYCIKNNKYRIYYGFLRWLKDNYK